LEFPHLDWLTGRPLSAVLQSRSARTASCPNARAPSAGGSANEPARFWSIVNRSRSHYSFPLPGFSCHLIDLDRPRNVVSAPIFINYSSKDQKIAETICRALEARGYNCWIAVRNVGPGENFQEVIVRACGTRV
jgi:TIR domain